MNHLTLTIDGKVLTASTPKVGHLKEFLKFQKEFDINRGVDINALDALSGILRDIFTDLTDEQFDSMDVAKFMQVFNDIAEWFADAMGGNEEKN